jgi:hypothetical protein
MGSLPIADAPFAGRYRPLRRGVAVLLALLVLGALAAGAVLFAWPGGSGWVSLGAVEEFQAGRPVLFAEHDLWLVRLESGEFLALYRKDPHLGCTVPFRPEFEFMGR